MAWGKEWKQPQSATEINAIWQNAQAIEHEKIKATGLNVWTKTFIENGEIKQEIIPPEEMYTNLKPTHDPYTNPGAMVYYECNCGAILDPKTKSFAHLNNAASVTGWKVRFGEVGYVPYCPKCGEGVE